MKPKSIMRRLAGNLDLASAVGRLQEAIDNQSTSVNEKLDRLHQASDNQSTSVNERLDKLIMQSRLVTSRQSEPRRGQRDMLNAVLASKPILLADLELVERFSHDWAANARGYRQALDDLRGAARRLLPLVLHPPSAFYVLSSEEIERLRAVENQITCLARQPLFFAEMFHGDTILPDGSSVALADEDAKHLRATGLLGIEDRRAIRKIYDDLLEVGGPLRVVEIGSAAGRGSTPIGAEYVALTGGVLYCIDPWPGSRYLTFLTNIQILDIEKAIVPIRSPSVEAAVLFEDGSLDAVFVDGSHLYPDVLADIDAYLPKIRKGGIMFGHDLYGLPSRFDRDELLRVAHLNDTLVSYRNPKGEVERVNAHPGVILAVQDRFGDAVEHASGSVVWMKKV